MNIDIDQAIRDIDRNICENINLKDSTNRELLSQNILAQLRNFVEHIAVKIYLLNSSEKTRDYETIKAALASIKADGTLHFLSKFHRLLQISVSHYTLDGNKSERLMLKYYEYLLRIKSWLKTEHNLLVLENIKSFPINQDPALEKYHEEISQKIKLQDQSDTGNGYTDRYYIHKVQPFFVKEEIYYEVTFRLANDKVSKFDRIIAFTSIDICSNYASRLRLVNDSIKMFGKDVSIKIIRSWETSIRPCELSNFATLLEMQINIQSNYSEYKRMMKFLDNIHLNLVDLITSSDELYGQFKSYSTKTPQRAKMFLVFDKARKILIKEAPGSNVIRYLLLRMNNKIIKQQRGNNTCDKLSNLRLQYGCIPFDKMPYNTSLIGHNPRILDLLNCIPSKEREHELFARFIKNNVEHRSILYTPVKDIKNFDNIDNLIEQYNSKLYYAHAHRKLEKYKDNIFIRGYEHDILCVVAQLSKLSTNGLKGYKESIRAWLKESSYSIDSCEKQKILKKLFVQSRVALIYGAAGTGKSTMVKHISHYFKDKNKLYLANTNPAIDNLRLKIATSNAKFKTITKHNLSADAGNYDILFIDECSTVSNSDMVKILDTAFKLIVLVGDIYQIESILFGNWFGAVKSLMPQSSVFELKEPFRTTNRGLLTFWEKVRNIDKDILEHDTKQNYSRSLDKSVLQRTNSDEIILCLNYDGFYGINNVNRILQSNNNQPGIDWGATTYKIGDPIIFNEIERFKPTIYNNLKGTIVGIKSHNTKVKFDIKINKSITSLDTEDLGLELIDTINGKSIISFFVYKNRYPDKDEDSICTVVPFQIAYAVSMHKAQGLEYKSVKIIITNEVDEAITHSILYTAITRARESLKIYWSPEVENKVLSNLKHKINQKDITLLSKKYSPAQIHPQKYTKNSIQYI